MKPTIKASFNSSTPLLKLSFASSMSTDSGPSFILGVATIASMLQTQREPLTTDPHCVQITAQVAAINREAWSNACEWPDCQCFCNGLRHSSVGSVGQWG